MQKLRYRSIGIAAIRFSRSVSGELGDPFDLALQTAELVKDRRVLYRDDKPAEARLAIRPFGATLSHRANCRHPRIGNPAVAWKKRGIGLSPCAGHNLVEIIERNWFAEKKESPGGESSIDRRGDR
jgi:hypothetical protein